MNKSFQTALGFAALALCMQASAQITFYESDGFRGRVFSTSKPVDNFTRAGFNDRASSVIVEQGLWQVCDDANYSGRCVVLQQGAYDSLSRLGLNDRVSSVRRVPTHRTDDGDMAEPVSQAAYEYRRRPNERVYSANVTSVRAVVGPPNERCWIERQQVSEPSRDKPNVGRGIAGALIGGILGHQVGGGSGKDLATIGGAVAGGAIGANMGRDRSATTSERDVRRCETTASSTPEFWDVSYEFRGTTHRVQMNTEPGRTIAVNRNGEPRQ
jgi:uncharacterized protein YcfJ